MSCDDCADGTQNEEDGGVLPLPSAVSGDIQHKPVHNVPKKVVIQDQSHDCPVDAIPVGYIKNKHTFALPACNQTVDVVFDKNIKHLMAGLLLYGTDPLQKTIRLKIQKVTPDNKLTLVNECSSCCASTKPIGESIPAETEFSWGIPHCCSSGTVNPFADMCLVGTFFFPDIGEAAPANVENSYNYVVGGLYSLGGFVWKVKARVTASQLLLENPTPGNGAALGGFLEGGTEGNCIYPITPISQADECADAGATEVVLVGCTSGGKRRLISDEQCGVVVYDNATKTHKVSKLLGGSTSTGPHYIEWDAANPCNSKLVYSADLKGPNCTATKCAIYLTPANTSQLYEVELESLSGISSIAPNNAVSIQQRPFVVVEIISPIAPVKVRVMPKFTVTSSETIPANTNVCVMEGCQSFPRTDYTNVFPSNPELAGAKVFCTNDGLRTVPMPDSQANGVQLVHFANDLAIKTGVVATVPVTDTALAINPSASYTGTAIGVLATTFSLDINNKAIWTCQLVDANGNGPRHSIVGVDATIRTYDVTITIPWSHFSGAQGAGMGFSWTPRVIVDVLSGASVPENVLWRRCTSRAHWMISSRT